MLAAAAAAAAAEAAARDAAETEAQQGSDAVLSVAMSAMAGDGGDAASTMGQDLYGHEQQLGGYEAANQHGSRANVRGWNGSLASADGGGTAAS